MDSKTGPFPGRKWSSLDRRSAILMLLMHLLCTLAPFQFTWDAFFIALSLYFITGLLGVTLSYHRNLAHGSFKLPNLLEYSFAYCALHALQGDPIDWVSTHRYHHQFVDTERDPHSPIGGFWFSHINWIFYSYLLTRKVSPKKVEDRENVSKIKKFYEVFFTMYVKHGEPNNVVDLQKQKFYRFLRRTYMLHIYGLAVILYVKGGLPYLVWGLGVRTVWGFHITFSVNSVCHTWGKQQWRTGDLSKNNWLVALLTFGEGWHNNHHAFEYSARQGLEWWQLDMTWWVILFLQALGLATEVKLPSESHKQRLEMRNDHVEVTKCSFVRVGQRGHKASNPRVRDSHAH